MTFQESFEKMRSLEQDLTFLSAKTEFDESNIPFKEKNLGIQNQDGIYTNLGLLLLRLDSDTFYINHVTAVMVDNLRRLLLGINLSDKAVMDFDFPGVGFPV